LGRTPTRDAAFRVAEIGVKSPPARSPSEQSRVSSVGAKARAAIPTRRFAKPWEIAATVMYLAGAGAAMINGTDIMVDGGYTIQ
jgi:NAD(P)-dependent dehydrogenase (short-subunit alcohol dehydrogenase family)